MRLILILIAINIITFALYGLDKKLAKEGKWRIPERDLLVFPLFGGSIGGIAGMLIFRHKTKHNKFRYGLPIILVLQIILAIVLIFSK